MSHSGLLTTGVLNCPHFAAPIHLVHGDLRAVSDEDWDRHTAAVPEMYSATSQGILHVIELPPGPTAIPFTTMVRDDEVALQLSHAGVVGFAETSCRPLGFGSSIFWSNAQVLPAFFEYRDDGTRLNVQEYPDLTQTVATKVSNLWATLSVRAKSDVAGRIRRSVGRYQRAMSSVYGDEIAFFLVSACEGLVSPDWQKTKPTKGKNCPKPGAFMSKFKKRTSGVIDRVSRCKRLNIEEDLEEAWLRRSGYAHAGSDKSADELILRVRIYTHQLLQYAVENPVKFETDVVADLA